MHWAKILEVRFRLWVIGVALRGVPEWHRGYQNMRDGLDASTQYESARTLRARQR